MPFLAHSLFRRPGPRLAPRPSLRVESLETRDVPSTVIVRPDAATTPSPTDYATVQQGIDAAVGFHYDVDGNGAYTAVPGDTVKIAAGTYAESVLLNKAVTLQPAANVSVENLTIELDQYASATLAGTLTVGHSLRAAGGIYSGLSGGTIAVKGDVTAYNPLFQGSTTYLLNGGGNQALTGVYGGYGLTNRPDNYINGPARLGSVTIDKPSGLLSIGGSLTTVGNWTHKSGAVDAVHSEIVVGGNQYGTQTIKTNGMSFGDLRIEGGAYQTVKALSSLDINGNFFLYSTANDGALYFTAPSVMTIAGNFGTTSVNSGTMPVFVAGTGKVVFDGGNNQIIAPTAVTFNDVEFNIRQYETATVVNNWAPNARGFAPIAVAGDLKITGGTYSGVNGGFVDVGGNVRSTNPTFQGTTTVELAGTADQTIHGSYGTGPVGRLPSVSINKPSGTAFVTGAIAVNGDWTHVAGSFDPQFSTVHFDGQNKTVTSDGTAFYSVDLAPHQYSALTLADTLKVTKNLTLGGGAYAFLAGRVEVEGNVTATNPTFQGSGLVAFVGDNYQTLKSAEGVLGRIPGVEIAKSTGEGAGRLTIAGDIAATGDWKYISGAVNAAKSNVIFQMPQYSTQTVTSGAMTFGSVTISGGTWSSLKLVGNLKASGDVTLSGADYSGLADDSNELVYKGSLIDSSSNFRNKGKVHK